MAKFDIKNAAISHVEKVVFGIVIIVVLMGLVGANWSPYQGTPGEIVQAVNEGEVNLAANRWPAEEREQFTDIETAPLLKTTLYANVDSSPYHLSERMYRLATGQDEPITEPELNKVESLIATSSRAFLKMMEDEFADEELEDLEMSTEEEAEEENIFGDELAERSTGAGALGAGGGYGSEMVGYSYGDMAAELDGYGGGGYGEEGDEYGMGPGGYGYGGGYGSEAGAGGAALPEQNGQGYHFVAVRAVFPLFDQIKKFAEATNTSFALASRKFQIVDFELQRQMRLRDGKSWTDWEPVDINVAYDVLDNVAGFETDVVNTAITNSVITMPLPMRISGAWKSTATHERIKDFVLDEKEMQFEREMTETMLRKLAESKKTIDDGKIQKKGFDVFQFDTNRMAGDLMGGYGAGGYGGGGGYGAGGYGAGGYGGGMGYAGGGGAAGRGARNKPAGGEDTFSSLVDALAEVSEGQRERRGRGEKESEEDIKERIEKWIKSRLSAAGQLMLFRYFDFGVEPGKTYRYRVRLVLENPNADRRVSDAGGMAHVVEGATRTTDWSNVTAPVKVDEELQFFLTEVSSPRQSRLLPTARVDVYQWDTDYGTMVNEKIDVLPGQAMVSTKDTEVIDLAKQTMEQQKYTFSSDTYLIDAMEDLTIDPDFHSGDQVDPSLRLKLPRGYSERFRNDAMILVKNGEGVLERVSESQGSKDHDYMKAYMAEQRKRYSFLDRSAVPAAGAGGYGAEEGYAGGYGGGGYGGGGYGGGYGGEMGMMSGGRDRNALRKDRRKSSRSGGRGG